MRRTIPIFVAVVPLAAALACGREEARHASSADAVASQPAAAPAEAPAGVSGAEAAPGRDVSFPGANVVTYVARDYAFEGPDRIPAGLTTLRLVNRGQDVHHLVLVKLTGGRTAQDLTRAMEAAEPEGEPPSWAVFEGGPNVIAPGGESNATAVLEPGSYVFVCVIPAADGVAHVVKGMSEAVDVVAEKQTGEWSEPAADLTVRLVDYDFQLRENISAGRHVVRVENGGDEPHELVLWQLPPGKSLADVVAWESGGIQGPPPAMPVGGIAPLKAGGHEYFVADLQAGDYALLCFLDDENGKPHIAHGMAKQFTVQ